jgi:hypothetical protein
MSKPCEYCGVDLPLGVDKGTRRVRSFHFASCEKRPQTTPHSPDIEAQRDALLEALRAAVADWDEEVSRGRWLDAARAAIKKAEEA